MSKVANIRQTLMLFSTTWLEGSKGFSFFFFPNNNMEAAQSRLWWTLDSWIQNRSLEIRGSFHASDINIAQLQMTNC